MDVGDRHGEGEEGAEGAARGNGGRRGSSESLGEGPEPPRAGSDSETGLEEEEEEAGADVGGSEGELPSTGSEGDPWATEEMPDRPDLSELGSWIRNTLDEALAASRRRLFCLDASPVTVLAVERYLAEVPLNPPSPTQTPASTLSSTPVPASSSSSSSSSYCYDLTITDGIFREKCHLASELNPLVHKNALHCGLQVKIRQCSYVYNEKRLWSGFLCIEQLEILGWSELDQTFQEWAEVPSPLPLKGSKWHYLPLWNNEDPYGDIWAEEWFPEDVTVDESKLFSLLQLDTSARTKINLQPLLVRIMYKGRLRYYGKPDTKVDVPYQAYFEVADHSGVMSMVLWNSLCPEWYRSFKIGTVLLLEQYAIKTCYPFKTLPAPGDLQMKRFSSIEITLNVRDPPTKITIIPENKVKADWKLPEVKYQFITRSELDELPDGHSCDIIGLVQYVGRTERTRKKDSLDEFWIYRCVHVLDGTSDHPFILELFASSQPEIFEQIHPMTYLVCTQMRVVREAAENSVYLTTTNESQMFITGWHKGQLYTKDSKVKNFIQWMKTQKEDCYLEKATMGGYYPFPPVPDTFLKYCKNLNVESVLTNISELEKEIESLHYREHKRIAFQGIISAIRYVSCTSTSQDALGGELTQMDTTPELQTSVSENDPIEEGGRQCQQARKLTSGQNSPSSTQQQHGKTRKRSSKRKFAVDELDEHLQESQDMEEAAQPHTSNNETTEVPERVQAKKMCHNSWESDLWTSVKDSLTQHLNYSTAFPESFPCKFSYAHREFLMQVCNLQASSWKPDDFVTDGEMNNLEQACPLEYYEVAILGINHDIAIDVAFLSIYCPEDSHLFRAGIPNCVALSHTGGTSCPQKNVGKEGHSELFSISDDEVVKAAANLAKQHVICILDICSLGEDKNEVFLNKVYKITDVDAATEM